MAKIVASSSAAAGEKMAPPSIALLPDKRSPTNGHSSPVRTGRTTPSNTEKRPHMNGHVSSLHVAANLNNSHGGKQTLEGYMKTDTRMRLAKERREERDRSLAAREQLIREKEHRARLQYERTVEERWRRLEEQRQKEELRRAAVEEKRRQQLEEERERLEALMKRSLERSLQLEQRSKHWSRGCAGAPCSPHRSPFRSSLNRADHNRAGLQGGSQSTPNTPKRERLHRERRTASPGCGSPLRRSESPASVTKHLASPTVSKLASRIRAQSPSHAHQNHLSPTRNHQSLSNDNGKADNKKSEKNSEQLNVAVNPLKRNPDINSINPAAKNLADAEIMKAKSSKGEHLDKNMMGDLCEKSPSPDRKSLRSPKEHSSEKKMQSSSQDAEKKRESAASPSTGGKVAAGTTNAEEATRLLAERRRQARAQKELEVKKREEEKTERVREEQLRMQEEKRQQEERRQQEEKARQSKEEKERALERMRQEEERQKKEQQERELKTQTDREREKTKLQAGEDAERQRQDREMQTQQEEEERQLRKKRIEEIMKRTRKGEAELKREEQVEAKSVSPPGDVKINGQVNNPGTKKTEFKIEEQVSVQVNLNDSTPVKNRAQMDSQKKSIQVKSNTHHVTSAQSLPDKGTNTKSAGEGQGDQCNKVFKNSVIKQQEKEVEMNRNKQHRVVVKVTEQVKKESMKQPLADNQREGTVMNGAVTDEGSALKTSSHATGGATKQQSLEGSAAEGKPGGGSRLEVSRPPFRMLPMGQLPPPVIKLEPMDVRCSGSGDKVQSMDISPVSKEELISIPEFSPVNEIQHCVISNTQALEDLIDLTGSATYPKLSSESTTDDCNKNLIGGVVSPMSDSKLVGVVPPSTEKLNIK